MGTSSVSTGMQRPGANVSRGRLEARWVAIWERLAETRHCALLIAGRGVISQYGYLEYVSGYSPIVREGHALIVPGHPPVLILPTTADAHEARRTVGLDVRVTGDGPDDDDLATTVAAVLREWGADGDLGVVGLAGILSAGAAERLARALPDRRLTDATGLLSELKARKTGEDVRELEITAAIADEGFEILRHRLRPGATPWELAGEVQGALRARGARDALVFVSAGPHLSVRGDPRPLAPGDLVSTLVELIGPTGYWVEFGGVFALGDLDPAREAIAQACLEASAAAAGLLRPGTPIAHVAAAIDERADAISARTGIWHGHGVGIDHDLPLISRASTGVVESGMAVAVHPNFSDREERFGAMVTDTYVVDATKARRLSRINQDLHRVRT